MAAITTTYFMAGLLVPELRPFLGLEGQAAGAAARSTGGRDVVGDVFSGSTRTSSGEYAKMMGDQPEMEMPEVPKPEAIVEGGEEGIRSGEMGRLKRRRGVVGLYKTMGQERSDATLGGMAKTLG